jgi:formylglycine-generating enzyme required for sulfatase activity
MNHSLSRLAPGRAVALVLAAGGFASAQIGTNYCAPYPNSTGSSAVIAASGSAVLPWNDLALTSSGLPPNVAAYFLCSRTQGFVMNPGGSSGNLCLSSPIGRRVGGTVLLSGPTGVVGVTADVTMMPQPTGAVAVQPGETWNFQCWYSDSVGGNLTSNFSDGLEVLFTATPTPVAGMVPIPAGTFQMGSRAPNSAPYYNGTIQQPAHQVTLSYPFWIGRYEVTQAEYQALIGWNPSLHLGASLPVHNLVWGEAVAYCATLTAQQASHGNVPPGYEYRLPTEAEWEYACRAGTPTEFHYGAELFCNQARIYYSTHSGLGCGPGGPGPVGSYAPNSFGLYDMHGNIWEWCLDTYAPYSAAAALDPFVTGGTHRILRSGCWFFSSILCRSATRAYAWPVSRYDVAGFRVVLGPVLVP